MQTIKESFYNIKTFLKSKESEIVRKYFTLLGYKYTSTIINNNFFHFATEALLMSLAKALKKDFIDVNSIPIEILSVEVNEEDFQGNLDILLGNADLVEHEIKFSYSKLASVFLTNFLYVREKYYTTNQNSRSEVVLTTAFESILRQSVNNCINELSCDEDLYLIQVYEELKNLKKKEKNENLEFKEFAEYYRSKLHHDNQSKKNQKFCVQNPCEVFYYYAQTSLSEFVNDLDSFNKQSSSIIYVVIYFIKSQYFNKFERLRAVYLYSLQQYSQIKSKFGDNYAVAKTNSYKKLEDLNKWVVSSYKNCNESLKVKFPSVHSKLCFVNENYLFPLGQKVYSLAGDSYSFVITFAQKANGKFSDLKNKIVTVVSETYQITKEKAEEYVTFTTEKIGEIQIVKITFAKLKGSKDEFEKIIETVYKQIREFDICQLKEYASTAYCYSKNKILQSYQKFLGCKESDSIDGKFNSHDNKEVEMSHQSTVASETKDK
jgi:hypothetical protein